MTCQICGYWELHEAIDLGMQPYANKYPLPGEHEDSDRLRVMFCTSCRSAQLDRTISRATMFEQYFYLSSVNTALVRHFRDLAHSLRGEADVIDVGSNDGILLAELRDAGIPYLGIEPSRNVAEIAINRGLATWCDFFTVSAAEAIAAKRGRASVIVASSVLTHADPHEFFAAARTLLAPKGKLIVEIEYIGDILETDGFERFYFDRPLYFSVTAIDHLCRQNGFFIEEIVPLEIHGGSLRFVMRRYGGRTNDTRVWCDRESQISPQTWAEFRGRAKTHAVNLHAALLHKPTPAYGAPARLSTICNFAKLGPEHIPFVIDDNPLKQGRLTPGTHIPIVPKPNEWPPQMLLFAYEYLADIRKAAPPQTRFYKPIPFRELT